MVDFGKCFFFGSIVISHRLSRSLSLSISLASRSATRKTKTRVFRPKQPRFVVCFFFSGLPCCDTRVCLCARDKLWPIVSLGLQKKQRKNEEVTNPNHSKFAPLFIFLPLNGGKLDKKMRLTTHTHTHCDQEQCVVVPLISPNVTQIVKSFQVGRLDGDQSGAKILLRKAEKTKEKNE